MRRIAIWRHGRTSWNAEQRFQGQTDIELDEVGIAQAQRAASMLASLPPSAIISSDLTRTRQTASPLVAITGIEPAYDEGLRETLAGEWEGKTRPVLLEEYGDDLHRWSADPSSSLALAMTTQQKRQMRTPRKSMTMLLNHHGLFT